MVNKVDGLSHFPIISYVCLGSNEGDSAHILRHAIETIDKENGLRVLATSKVYRTEPQGLKEQNWFHNQIISIACADFWTAEYLLNFLLKVEKMHGRVRGEVQDAPRTLDLDLLLFGQEVITHPQCTLPHARMFLRAFVLIPLREIIAQDALDFLQSGHATSNDYIDSRLLRLAYIVRDDKIFQR